MNSLKISILIPHYKTLELTKLCLQLLKKNTSLTHAKFIVIDNDSQDESSDYLKTVPWISLIERKKAPDDDVYLSHSRALDLAMEQVDTPFVLSIHTDTFVRRTDWLDFLLAQIELDPMIAGVGSWKLEEKSFLREIAKKLEYSLQSFYYKLIGKKQHALEGKDDNFFYLRSHCALYRTDLLRQYGLSFAAGDGTAGREIHRELVKHNYKMIFLPSRVLSRYMAHVNHATMVLNPHLGTGKKNQIKGLKRLKQSLQEFQ